MPTNYRKGLKPTLNKIKRDFAKKTVAKVNLGTTGKIAKLDRKAGPDASASEVKDFAGGAVRDIQFQLARRLAEILAAYTPQKEGYLNGGWTFNSKGVKDRINKSYYPLAEEIQKLIRQASNGDLNIKLGNAVEYASFVNYGDGGAPPRMYVEMALDTLEREARSSGINLSISRG